MFLALIWKKHFKKAGLDKLLLSFGLREIPHQTHHDFGICLFHALLRPSDTLSFTQTGTIRRWATQGPAGTAIAQEIHSCCLLQLQLLVQQILKHLS